VSPTVIAARVAVPDRYKWVALSNTTLGVLMAALDGSIVIVALPAIFRGIGLDPLAPGNIGYLLWMILGYLLVSAVLVVTFGRLGDMFGRVPMYNLGFLVFSIASLALSVDPFTGANGALWLIGLRMVQAVGGAMLTANSAAILTDAFPAEQRGMALGINQITALAVRRPASGRSARRGRLARSVLDKRAHRDCRHHLVLPQLA
jgi:MFS family permease